MLWLQLVRVGCGGTAAILLGAGVDTSTDGESHAFVTYLSLDLDSPLVVTSTFKQITLLQGRPTGDSTEGLCRPFFLSKVTPPLSWHVP